VVQIIKWFALHQNQLTGIDKWHGDQKVKTIKQLKLVDCGFVFLCFPVVCLFLGLAITSSGNEIFLFNAIVMSGDLRPADLFYNTIFKQYITGYNKMLGRT